MASNNKGGKGKPEKALRLVDPNNEPAYNARGQSKAEAEAYRAKKDAERARRLAAQDDPNAPIDTGLAGKHCGMGKGAVRELFVVTLDDGTRSEQWLVCPAPEKRCVQKVRNGIYRGYQCRNRRLPGATVCTPHGGRLPQVKKAAQARLIAATDMVAAELVGMAMRKGKVADADRLRAMTGVLDRAGVDGKQSMIIEVRPWQEVLSALAGGKSKKGKKGKSKAKKAKQD